MPASTPVLAMPYPLATEPVSQGDDAIKALAERVEAVLGSPWVAYGTPATMVTGTVANPNAGTDGVVRGFYRQVGKTVHYRIEVRVGSVGGGLSAGSGRYDFLLPVPAKMNVGQEQNMGIGNVGNSAGTQGLFLVLLSNTDRVHMLHPGGTLVTGSTYDYSGASQNYHLHGTYEAA